jgi:hypothetical protein
MIHSKNTTYFTMIRSFFNEITIVLTVFHCKMKNNTTSNRCKVRRTTIFSYINSC